MLSVRSCPGRTAGGWFSTKTEETTEDPYKQEHDDEKDSRNNSEADQNLRHLNREQRLGRPAVFDSIVDQLLNHSVEGTLSDCFELDGLPSKPVGPNLYALTTVEWAHSGWRADGIYQHLSPLADRRDWD
jgi:hypothetical protein